jgi:hypothetical protein
MNDTLEMILKEAVLIQQRYYPGTCVEGLRKATKSGSQDSWCPGRHSNRTLRRYKSEALPLHQHVWSNVGNRKCSCSVVEKGAH